MGTLPVEQVCVKEETSRVNAGCVVGPGSQRVRVGGRPVSGPVAGKVSSLGESVLTCTHTHRVCAQLDVRALKERVA